MSTRLHDTATRIIEVLYLVIVLVGFTLVIIAANAYGASNSFVQMLERREGVYPGQTKVLPDCGCTIRYIGTQVSGRDYYVHIQKLD